MSELIEIIVNGKAREVNEGTSLAALIKSLGLDLLSIVVEYNETVADKATLGSVILTANDKVEILQFVGGG